MFPNESRRISADSYFATAKRESVSFRLTRVLGGRNCLSGHGLLASLLGPALPWTAFLVLRQYPCSVCRISVPPFARNGCARRPAWGPGVAWQERRRDDKSRQSRSLAVAGRAEKCSNCLWVQSGDGGAGRVTALWLAQFRVNFLSPLCLYFNFSHGFHTVLGRGAGEIGCPRDPLAGPEPARRPLA